MTGTFKRFTPDEKDFIKEYAPGHSRAEITEALNKRFDANRSITSVGVYAGISTIKEFGILYLVCAMFIWLIIYLVTNCAFHDEESYVYWFKQKKSNKQ